MRRAMTTNHDSLQNARDWFISIQLPQDMFWPAVGSVVCLSVVLVESVLAIVLLVSR